GGALPMQVFGVAGDVARLFLGVPYALHAELFAGVAFGPQGLAQAALVGSDQAGRRAQYRRRRTVVALQANNFRPGEVALEAQDVLDLCTAPGIDRLVVVA